jgi:FMN phosphatase YigB (HAD superfamily)
LALDLTQVAPEESCFVDDRALNVEAAARLGMQTIRLESASQLKQEFERLGVAVAV